MGGTLEEPQMRGVPMRSSVLQLRKAHHGDLTCRLFT